MTEEQLRTVVLKIIGEVAPDADLKNLDPAMKFRDQFPFDSVDFLTFVIRIQKELGLNIPEQDCPKLAALGDCITYLKGKTESRGGLYGQSHRHS